MANQNDYPRSLFCDRETIVCCFVCGGRASFRMRLRSQCLLYLIHLSISLPWLSFCPQPCQEDRLKGLLNIFILDEDGQSTWKGATPQSGHYPHLAHRLSLQLNYAHCVNFMFRRMEVISANKERHLAHQSRVGRPSRQPLRCSRVAPYRAAPLVCLRFCLSSA